jgi:DNA-binding IscR family transcriptional regulator
MSSIDDYILGNDVLHYRFSVTTQIVGKVVCSAPDWVAIDQLKELTGYPVKELSKLCGHLSVAGVLEAAIPKQDAWRLACDPRETTLADIFRCILAERLEHSRQLATKRHHTERSYRDIDLLLMQLSIAINQSVFRHLRQFPLDHLKLRVSGIFPFTERPVPSHRPYKAQHASAPLAD